MIAATRRALLAALVAILAVPGVAGAQDPRASSAQLAARQWLALVDRLEAKPAWNAAGQRFRDQLPLARWTALVQRDREPRGQVVSRTIEKTGFRATMRGLPEGDYAIILFNTSFSNRPQGGEQVTLERGTDGVWRVIGYVVR